MVDESPKPERETEASPSPDADDSVERLRFAKLEGRIRALEARFEDVIGAERGRRQRALYVRLLLLALLLGGFFFLRLKGVG